MEIEFAKGGEIDWTTEFHKPKYFIMFDAVEKNTHIACNTEYHSQTLPFCLDNIIIENFTEQNEEELKAYFKWMQEYNSWKGEK
jgi:hypothetical protein